MRYLSVEQADVIAEELGYASLMCGMVTLVTCLWAARCVSCLNPEANRYSSCVWSEHAVNVWNTVVMLCCPVHVVMVQPGKLMMHLLQPDTSCARWHFVQAVYEGMQQSWRSLFLTFHDATNSGTPSNDFWSSTSIDTRGLLSTNINIMATIVPPPPPQRLALQINPQPPVTCQFDTDIDKLQRSLDGI